ncbi:phage portal protein [Eubacterium multiforme]|uniref:HK97 family phage portal protein n=1 Tax=Eubacterium multiforme TaxID=83339 RepID=A0ABT9US35_9FIRM|nr:phage portal protein [Eubacterium multiforme]MDQ0149131.1 HK97 family phage portal protein [Eubacterium multiforme]
MFEKIFKKDNKPSNVSNPEQWFVDLIGGRLTESGMEITPNLALNLSAVYRCCSIRSGTISKMPLQTFRKTIKGKQRIFDNSSYLLEVRPNRLTTPSQLKKMISIDIDLWGNAYVLIKNNRESLNRLEPWRTTISIMSDGSLRYKYQNPIALKQETFTDEEVMHFKDWGTDGILGKSKIQLARETLGNARAGNKLLSKYYKNGTLSKGLLIHPETLEDEPKANIKKAWREVNAGIENSYDIPILDSGIEYKDISMSFEDAQFLNLNKFSVEEIGRFFNVPPYMLGIMDGAKFNNVQSQAMDFISNSIQPLLTDVEEEFNYKYYYTSEKNKGTYCKFNMAVAMRADDISRATFYEKMLNIGLYSINKCLSKEDEEEIGSKGDKHYRSLNYVDVDMMEEYQRNKSMAIRRKDNEK